jgi:hypothetical protein
LCTFKGIENRFKRSVVMSFMTRSSWDHPFTSKNLLSGSSNILLLLWGENSSALIGATYRCRARQASLYSASSPYGPLLDLTSPAAWQEGPALLFILTCVSVWCRPLILCLVMPFFGKVYYLNLVVWDWYKCICNVTVAPSPIPSTRSESTAGIMKSMPLPKNVWNLLVIFYDSLKFYFYLLPFSWYQRTANLRLRGFILTLNTQQPPQ